MITRAHTDQLHIIVLGYVVRGPLGGMVWSNLQYLKGLMRLGHDVYFLEDSDDYPSCYDPIRYVTDTHPDYGLSFADSVFSRIGMGQRWAYHDAHTGVWHGPASTKVKTVCAQADILLNLCGVNPIRPWLMEIPVRVLVDEDPAFTQIRHIIDPDARQRAKAHNAFFTFAENIGKANCRIPEDGFPWQATRQPLVRDSIKPYAGKLGAKFTTVMQWDSYPGREYGGCYYGMKSDSFEPYLTLPSQVEESLEIALGGKNAPRQELTDSGWHIVDPFPPTRDPLAYEDYIRESKAELSVAKHGYVVSGSGWFSERSVTYLATGRPVVVQETGFSDWLQRKGGVLSFSSPAEARDAINDVAARYVFHCLKAREIAEEYFESEKVLSLLLEHAFTSSERIGKYANK